jgi:hypothetical protein
VQEGEKGREKERERKRFELLHETSLPFGPALPSSFVPKLLVVGRGVIAQAPSSSNNTNNKRNSKLKEIYCFQQ